MHPGVVLAIITATLFGLWTVFHQQASNHINNLFGAIIVSLTAVILGALLFLPSIKSVTLYSNPKGIVFAILAGVCALGLDYFALKTYSSGLQVSIGGPIIIGGSIAVASIIGFFLGESITLPKLIGLTMVIVGSSVLAAFTK